MNGHSGVVSCSFLDTAGAEVQRRPLIRCRDDCVQPRRPSGHGGTVVPASVASLAVSLRSVVPHSSDAAVPDLVHGQARLGSRHASTRPLGAFVRRDKISRLHDPVQDGTTARARTKVGTHRSVECLRTVGFDRNRRPADRHPLHVRIDQVPHARNVVPIERLDELFDEFLRRWCRLGCGCGGRTHDERGRQHLCKSHQHGGPYASAADPVSPAFRIEQPVAGQEAPPSSRCWCPRIHPLDRQARAGSDAQASLPPTGRPRRSRS